MSSHHQYNGYSLALSMPLFEILKFSRLPFCNIFSIQMSQQSVRQPFSPRPVPSTRFGSSSESVSSRHQTESSRHQTESAAPLSVGHNLPTVSMFLAAQSSCGGCLDLDIPVSLKKHRQNMIISAQDVLKIHVNSSSKCVPSLLIKKEKVMLSRIPPYLFIAEVCLPTK